MSILRTVVSRFRRGRDATQPHGAATRSVARGGSCVGRMRDLERTMVAAFSLR